MDRKLEKEIGKILEDQAMDQATAGLHTLADIMSTYYRLLVEGGLPAELAGQLVRDWHATSIKKLVGQ